MAYQPLIGGKEVGLLEALRGRAGSKCQAAAIHAYKLLQRYGLPICNRSGEVTSMSVVGGLGLAIRPHSHNHGLQQIAIGWASNQEAADKVGVDDVGRESEEVFAKGWE
jgi:hypothetical protein